MILACPHCTARYLVPAAVFAGGPRAVRCARCNHSWQADIVPESPISPPSAPSAGAATNAARADAAATPKDPPKLPPLTEPPQTTPPIPPGSNLPALWKNPKWAKWRRWLRIALPVGAFVLVLAVVALRQSVVNAWPGLEPAYSALGFVFVHPADSLSLENVHSEQRYEDGGMRLVVSGEIRNHSTGEQAVPLLRAAAMGPDGKEIQSWRIDPPVAKLARGASTTFHSSVNTPPGTAVEINLSFVGSVHERDE